MPQNTLVEIVASMTFFRMMFGTLSLNILHLCQKSQARHRSLAAALGHYATVTKVKCASQNNIGFVTFHRCSPHPPLNYDKSETRITERDLVSSQKWCAINSSYLFL